MTSEASATTKTCGACQSPKPREAFARDSSRPDGLTYLCRDCRNAKARSGYQPKPRRRRGWLKATRDGDKKQARRRVNYLVEQGRIPHPSTLACLDCGDLTTDHEYDHARGYDGENQLYVEPVCIPCHHKREESRHV